MQDAAAILTPGGDITYCNQSFAGIISIALQEVIGGRVTRYFEGDARQLLDSLLAAGSGKRRTRISTPDARSTSCFH